LSHSKERSEKICLNCNADLHGRFCHVCGQENREPKETVLGLITHFFYDITHFDGKFFSTLKYLIAKPGFLSAEYIKGRRSDYLNPIRMYIFTSAFFFIIFFSVYNPDDFVKTNEGSKSDSTTTSSMRDARTAALKYAETKEDSADIIEALNNYTDTTKTDTSRKVAPIKMKMKSPKYKTFAQYDSAQKTLPAYERDGWFKRTMNERQISIRQKYGDDPTVIMKVWVNTLLHQFPKLLFVSLPIFALILRLLYIRRRKQFFYVDHGIFAIHLYIFSFILLLGAMLLNWIGDLTGWSLFGWLQAVLWIYYLYYNYKAMRTFYRQGRGKTILKFILLNMLAQVAILFLFVLFFIITAFQL
jgi:hypothetical protein